MRLDGIGCCEVSWENVDGVWIDRPDRHTGRQMDEQTDIIPNSISFMTIFNQTDFILRIFQTLYSMVLKSSSLITANI